MIFFQVFTLAQQLASSYEKLCQGGCLLFSEWKLTLHCQRLGKVSVHVDFGVGNTEILAGTKPLLKEMENLREFLTSCIGDWQRHVDSQRNKLYYLNYYTIEQLVRLRQGLAVFTNAEPDSLDAQVFALLSSVKHQCSLQEVKKIVKSVIGNQDRSASNKLSAERLGEQKLKVNSAEDEAQMKLREKLRQAGNSDFLINAAFAAVGTRKPVIQYKKWLKENKEKYKETVPYREKSQQQAKHDLVSDIAADERFVFSK